MVNEPLFRQWWDIFHSHDKVVELRLISNTAKKEIQSGYFSDCNTALLALSAFNTKGYNVYSPLNTIHEGCRGRLQYNNFQKSADNATSDKDIVRRRWLMIDFDPKRPKGINSTLEERDKAKQLMRKVGIYLRDVGFPAPVVLMSGNGYHLYYKIDLPNDSESRDLNERFLRSLDMQFSNEHCDVDITTFNASRITKVAGTISAKGANNSDRPQREVTFVQVPEDIEEVGVEMILKVASVIPAQETPSRFNNYQTSFDLEDFISRHGIEIEKRIPFNGGERLLLKHCPFDSTHLSPDSAIFKLANGAIGFKCLHNSCANYTWRDVRIHYEPDAYSTRDRDIYRKKREYYSTAEKPAPIIIEEKDDLGKKWQSMTDIEWQDPSKLVYIPSGVQDIDRNMGGLALGDVSIISGLAGSGKTSLLNHFILNAIQHGYKCSIWSGELMASRFKSWFNQAAAGGAFVAKSAGEHEYYYCPKKISELIDRWSDKRVFLYNNNYGNHISQLMSDIKSCIKDNGTQLIVFDNKMAMKLDSYDGDKNERDAGLINELKDFAMANQLHIILVCHPRKEAMNALLRMESISGNSDLYNAAANVFLCHRVGNDFNKRATEFFGKNAVDSIVTAGYNEVIEIAKNRTHGVKDMLACLYFDFKTRRFLNTKDENIVYEWQEFLPENQRTIKINFAPNDGLPDMSCDFDDLPL